jgi:ribosomal protein S18 acetylase RimI-like enzyme
MKIRPYRREDEAALAGLSATCARGEGDFVLNPIWEDADEFAAEFERFGIDPESHVIVAEDTGGETIGFAGFLRRPEADLAGLICPIVKHGGRRRGVGGELLRAAQELATTKLGIRCATAGIGTRNRAGYSLLASHGFRPVRQHFYMRCDIAPQIQQQKTEGLELELELAQPDDCDAILEIYLACGFEPRPPEVMRACLLDGRHVFAVARRSGEIVAFSEFETHLPNRTWVAYVGVNDDLRGRGVGSALVAWSLARQFEAGAVSAMLLLSPANRTALRAYEKVGFRRSRLIDVLEKNL